jgi:hypothetical protein
MKLDITLEKQIEMQIAHVMASYGDQPEEFLYKMQCLVIDWYCKGLSAGIETERKHNAELLKR